MRVLLDTTALYVAAGLNDVSVPKRVREMLEHPDTEPFLSVVSIMEIAIKANKGLTSFTPAHIAQAQADLQLTILPFTAVHAYGLFDLPPHHKDPWDRMLIATALTEDVPIISGDKQFKKYRGLRVIW